MHDEKITEVDEAESPQKMEDSNVRDWIRMQEQMDDESFREMN